MGKTMQPVGVIGKVSHEQIIRNISEVVHSLKILDYNIRKENLEYEHNCREHRIKATIKNTAFWFILNQKYTTAKFV